MLIFCHIHHPEIREIIAIFRGLMGTIYVMWIESVTGQLLIPIQYVWGITPTLTLTSLCYQIDDRVVKEENFEICEKQG